MKRVADRLVIDELQKKISHLQGNQQRYSEPIFPIGLGEMESAFPEKAFPKGVIHEMISTSSEGATCTSGFISVVLGKIMQQSGYCLWISTIPRRSIYPPALKAFGIDPEKILFVDTPKTKDTLWAIEEALKCDSLVAVVGELTELNFNDSRRLQLAVEQSHVTGFIHRFQPKIQNAVACATRWKINSMASTESDLPGLGFSRWDVQLLKVRNGQPGNWQVQWSPDGLEYIHTEQYDTTQIIQLQTG
jgi:protein ImuA